MSKEELILPDTFRGEDITAQKVSLRSDLSQMQPSKNAVITTTEMNNSRGLEGRGSTKQKKTKFAEKNNVDGEGSERQNWNSQPENIKKMVPSFSDADFGKELAISEAKDMKAQFSSMNSGINEQSRDPRDAISDVANRSIPAKKSFGTEQGSVLKQSAPKQKEANRKTPKRTSTELDANPPSPYRSILKPTGTLLSSGSSKQNAGEKKVAFFPKKTVFYVPKLPQQHKNSSQNNFWDDFEF